MIVDCPRSSVLLSNENISGVYVTQNKQKKNEVGSELNQMNADTKLE